MKFRKKPVVIEAVQWLGTKKTWDEVMRLGHFRWNPGEAESLADEWYIETLEGNHRVSRGDWIIRGVAGEFYPCKPDIFAATYEPAEESNPVAQ